MAARMSNFHALACCWVLLIAFASLAPGEETAPAKATVQARWLERIVADLKLAKHKDDNYFAAELAIAALAESGDGRRAITYVREVFPPDRQKFALTFFVARVQSSAGELDAALATVRELPAGKDRESGIQWVAQAQARRGDVNSALALLPQLTQQIYIDRVRGAAAEAQSLAGRIELANTTAAQIVDQDIRRSAQQAIARAAAGHGNPVAQIRSRLLREQLETMLEFSGDNRQQEALAAMTAAQKKDEKALADHIQAALAVKSIPLEQATTRVLLATALVEAGKREEAQKVIAAARDATGKESLGVGGVFGNPILVYLLIRLDREADLDALVIGEPDDSLEEIARAANVHTAGATYAEIGRLDLAEKRYEAMKSPLDRLYLASGVIDGLKP